MKSQLAFVSSFLLAPGIARAHEGVISGNAIADTSDPVAVVGMLVELHDVGGGGDPLATDATGEGGFFALEYDTGSTDPVDLYLKFISETEDGTIRVRRKDGPFRVTRFEEIFEDAPIGVSSSMAGSETVDLGDVLLDPHEARPQLLHWANRARMFVNSQLDASPLPEDRDKPLDIMESPIPGTDGGFFVPGLWYDELILSAVALYTATTGLVAGPLVLASIKASFSDQDGVYLGESSQESEGTVYHEFGHYFMWHAQGEKWLNPLTASFANHGSDRNASNPKLAWTEGWADGFGLMVDSWSANDDGDGDDDVAEPGDAGVILCKDGSSSCSQQALTHGFWSEEFIANTVYDLWDGIDNLSGLTIPPVITDHDDGGADEIEMKFADLAQPILDTKDLSQDDLINDIVDYHDRLTDLDLVMPADLSAERALDRELTELFTEHGKVRNLIVPMPSPEQVFGDRLNTDAISFSREIEVQTFKDKAGTLKEADKDKATFSVDVPKLSGLDDTFNLCSTGSGHVSEALLDDLTITGTMATGAASLRINFPGPVGWQSGNNTYGAPAGPIVSGEAHLDVTIGGNMKLTAIDGGTIRIGQPAAPFGLTADVTLDAGATLTLGGGEGGANPAEEFPGGPLVSKGRLFIDNGSRLVVERDATLVIKRGAEITLVGSELVIRGNLVVEEHATFQWTAINGGMVTFDLEDGGDGDDPNLTMEPNSTISISETAFTIASGTYVMPSSDSPGSRTIVIEHGSTGLFGEDAYLDTTGTSLTLRESTIEALSPPDKHNGVRVDDNPAVIDGMTFSGGWTCIEELGSVPGIQDALLISSSDFADCSIAIAVDNRSLELSGVIIDDGVTGVSAFAVPNVSVSFSEIKGQTDRGLEMVQSSGATIKDSTFLANNVGIEIDNGALLRLDGATIAQNSVGVRATDGATVNAGEVIGVKSWTLFDRNRVSIQLQDAGVPILAGENLFYPATGAGVRSISGTIDDSSTACVGSTILIGTDLWHNWLGPVFGWSAVSLDSSPYSISSSAGGCGFTYTLAR